MDTRGNTIDGDTYMEQKRLLGENELLMKEGTMWMQRSRVEWLKCGDLNAIYFHRESSWRAKKINKILFLRKDDGTTMTNVHDLHSLNNTNLKNCMLIMVMWSLLLFFLLCILWWPRRWMKFIFNLSLNRNLIMLCFIFVLSRLLGQMGFWQDYFSATTLY